jgi:hypothetical protein
MFEVVDVFDRLADTLTWGSIKQKFARAPLRGDFADTAAAIDTPYSPASTYQDNCRDMIFYLKCLAKGAPYILRS